MLKDPAGPRMSAYETLRVIERHLVAEPGALLSDDVKLHDMARSEVIDGREAVGSYLRRLRECVANAAVTDLRLTIDEGRAAAEWVLGRDSAAGEEPVPMACFYEVSSGRVETIRLYYDTTSLRFPRPIEQRTSFAPVERLPDAQSEAGGQECCNTTVGHRPAAIREALPGRGTSEW